MAVDDLRILVRDVMDKTGCSQEEASGVAKLLATGDGTAVMKIKGVPRRLVVGVDDQGRARLIDYRRVSTM